MSFSPSPAIADINPDFASFIEQTEKLLIATDKFYKATKREYEEFCDPYFEKDSDILIYCKENHIPIDSEN